MLHKAVKMLRLYHQLPAHEMAAKLNIFSSKLSLYEKGTCKISVAMLERYAKVFNMKSVDILAFAEKLKTKKGLEAAIFEGIKETIRGA